MSKIHSVAWVFEQREWATERELFVSPVQRSEKEGDELSKCRTALSAHVIGLLRLTQLWLVG
jgi:hypothetical protein